MEGTCPCGSGVAFASCCGPLHEGRPATTAEVLMRSRYSAFVLGRTGYLADSWHPRTRPPAVEADEATRWRRLQIVDTDRGGPDDDAGTVEFRAAYRDATGATGVLHERSRFVREGGRWYYVDGDILP